MTARRQAYSVGSTFICLNLATVSWKALISLSRPNWRSVLTAVGQGMPAIPKGELLRPRAVINVPASMGSVNWAAPRTNSSRQLSSNKTIWSREGNVVKAGTLLAQRTFMNSKRAADSQIVSGLKLQGIMAAAAAAAGTLLNISCGYYTGSKRLNSLSFIMTITAKIRNKIKFPEVAKKTAH